MKNLKKVLALVVVFAMMLSTVAFAGTFADVADDAAYAGAVETLASLGYFLGDENGNFNPDATITRAEYATIVCRLLGIADSATGKADFADVAADHWATSYIKMANQYGIVAGYGDGNFGPEDTVKYEEAIKMLVCALGYEPMALSKGGWPTGYVATASQIGLLDGIYGAAEGAGASRAIVAMMTYNALDIPIMEQIGFGTEISYEIMKETDDHDKSTLLTKVGIFKLGGLVAANSKVDYSSNPTANAYAGLEAGKVGVEVDDDFDTPERALRLDVYNNVRQMTFGAGETNAEDLVGNKVIVYVAKATAGRYEIKAIEIDNDSTQTLTIKASDLNDNALNWGAASPYVRYYKEGVTSGEGTKINLATGYTVTWNNNDGSAAIGTLDSTDTAVIEFVDWNNDNKYDIVNVTEYRHLVVEAVDAAKGIIDTYNGTKVNLDIENEDAIVSIKDINGNALDIEEIETDDVLALVIKGTSGNVSPSLNVLRTANYDALDVIVLKDSTVTGKVTEADPADNTVVIGDKEYDVDVTWGYDTSKVKLQAEGTYYLGINGEIVGFEGDRVSSDNYGYILNVVAPIGKNYDTEVEMLTKDGTIVDYDLADTIKIINPYTGEYTRAKGNEAITSASNYSNALAGTTWATLITGSISGAVLNDSAGNPVESNSVRLEIAKAFEKEMDDASYNTVTLKNAEAAKRLVIFKANSNGEITEIIPAYGTAKKVEDCDLSVSTPVNAMYDVDAQKIGAGNYLTDDVVVFDIDYSEPSKSKVVALDYFVDESTYDVVLYNENADGQYGAAVITSSSAIFAKETGIAIVTSKSTIMDEEDNELVKIEAIQDGATVVLTFEDTLVPEDSTADASTYDIGTMFEYVANDAGEVSKYRTIGAIDWTSGANYAKEFAFDVADSVSGIDEATAYGYYYGYIENISKNENEIRVRVEDSRDNTTLANPTLIGSAVEFTVTKANQYSVTGNNKKNTTIYNGGYVVGDIDSATMGSNGKLYAHYVLVRTYEGEVIDVVSFDTSAIELTTSYAVAITAGAYTTAADVQAAELSLVMTVNGVNTTYANKAAMTAAGYTWTYADDAANTTVTVTVKNADGTTVDTATATYTPVVVGP